MTKPSSGVNPIVVVLVLALSLLGGCGGAARLGGAPNVEVPATASSYSTEARSGGVRGGGTASDAEDLLEKQLAPRGDEAAPDGALADTAAWFLQRAYKNEDVSAVNLGIDAAHRFGFAGEYYGCVVLQLDRDDHAVELLASGEAEILLPVP